MPLWFLRRDFLVNLLRGGTASALCWSGCKQQPVTNPSAGGSKSPGPIEITFHENENFYKELERCFQTSVRVMVKFDGEDRIGRDSRLNAYLAKATNAAAIQDSLKLMGEEEGGREALSSIFRNEMLEHEKVPNHAKPLSGEPIEPAAAISVISIAITEAAESKAHSTPFSGQPYHTKFLVSSPGASPPGGIYFMSEDQ